MTLSEPCSLSTLAVSPWKNGGGSTRTLAIEPSSATLDDFLWRISLAEINEPSSFSTFPGIDRTILLWSGRGVVLHGVASSQTLDQPLVPFTFPGEDAMTCELVDGTSSDLNVMVRRGIVEAEVNRFDHAITLSRPLDTFVIICASGEVDVRFSDGRERLLRPGQFLRIDHCDLQIACSPSRSGATFLVIFLQCIQAENMTFVPDSMPELIDTP